MVKTGDTVTRRWADGTTKIGEVVAKYNFGLHDLAEVQWLGYEKLLHREEELTLIREKIILKVPKDKRWSLKNGVVTLMFDFPVRGSSRRGLELSTAGEVDYGILEIMCGIAMQYWHLRNTLTRDAWFKLGCGDYQIKDVSFEVEK